MSTSERRIYFNEQGYEKVIMCMSRTRNADYHHSSSDGRSIRTYRAIDREKEFYGILKAYDADTVTIEQEDGKEMVFEKSNIALIRLAFDF